MYRGPLSLIPVGFSDREGFVKGALLLRGLRTLDKCLPIWNLESEGKGAGGLRGLVPWRSMRQRLMRALRRAARPSGPPLSLPTVMPSVSLKGFFHWVAGFHAWSPCFHPHSLGSSLAAVPMGVLNSWGAAI